MCKLVGYARVKPLGQPIQWLLVNRNHSIVVYVELSIIPTEQDKQFSKKYVPCLKKNPVFLKFVIVIIDIQIALVSLPRQSIKQ